MLQRKITKQYGESSTELLHEARLQEADTALQANHIRVGIYKTGLQRAILDNMKPWHKVFYGG